MSLPLQLNSHSLFLPLRTVFKQASSVRAKGESVWCHTHRNGLSGYGEGCPRIYVTNEQVTDALEWIIQKKSTIEKECTTLDLLKIWITENRTEIDQHPAAFCAVETSLLDLFAREQHVSVEKALDLGKPEAIYSYTAILSDSREDKYIALCQKYLNGGFTDFKVKVNGDLKKDQAKLRILQELSQEHGLSDIRIRLDANNLWKGDTTSAIQHLSGLEFPIFGIEEPVSPKDYEALSSISHALGLPIILDESLCNLADLAQLDKVGGAFIANLKVSRIGGVIRSLEMVKALKERGYQIIIGAHVGETSVLTRAGMCVASSAGKNLIAQEGGYGQMLLEKDPMQPSLMFGARGQIDLTKPYPVNRDRNTIDPPNANWGLGWGLEYHEV